MNRKAGSVLEVYRDLGAGLLADQSLNGVLATVVLKAIGNLGFRECVIFLWDDATESLVARAARGSARHQQDPEMIRRLRSGEGIVGSAFKLKSAVLVGDTRCDTRYVRDLVPGLSEIAVPIIHGEDVLGVIDSEHPSPDQYDQQDVEALQMVANMVAPKIACLRARESARRWRHELKRSRQSMREMISTAPSALYLLDYTSKLMVEGLEGFAGFLGFSAPEIEAMPEGVYSLIHPDDVDVVAGQERAMREAADGVVVPVECRLRTKSGRYRWVLIKSKVFKRGASGEPSMEVGSVTDISSLKRAQEELRLKETFTRGLLENGFDGFVVYDQYANVTYASPSVARFTGYSESEVDGANALDFVVTEDHAEANRAWFDLLERPGGHAILEQRVRHKSGRITWIEARLTNRLNDPNIGGIISNFHDVTERKEAERRIHELANYDALTGLPNRRLLMVELAEALVHARRRDEGVVLLYMDLDRFKDVNDTLGHDIGDLLLGRVASSAKALIGQRGVLGRLGGDEFAVVLEGAEIQDGTRIASQLIDAMETPFQVRDYDIRLTASIGVARFPDHGDAVEDLFKHADIAMYRAKNRRNRFSVFEIDDARAMAERVQLEKDLQQAIEQGEFELYYQPRIDVASGNYVGAEALLRWHRDGRIVLPGTFIPVAEDTGLIYKIGEWVLDNACKQAGAWQRKGLSLRVAVNVSARELLRSDIVDQITRALERHAVPPELLEIELTETAAMSDLDLTIRAMHALRARGVKLAIDDFGTGHSSLSYLRHLPVDFLKIDQSFLPQGEEQDPDDPQHSIMTGIVLLTESAGLCPVAEGVESEEQFNFLKAVGCREAQGFWLARPMPASQLEELLA